jgi:WD40 repeat protein
MSGKLLLTLRGHASAVLGVSFSADGQRLASASTDRTVKLWDALNGEELLTLKGHAAFRESVSIAFNTDSRRLAVASTDHKVIIWDATPRDVQPMSKP